MDNVADPAGDAVAGIDLVNVKLVKANDSLQVTWTLASPLPSKDTVGLYLNVASADGSEAGQLGVKYLDGKQIAHFVYLGTTNRNVTGPVVVDGKTVTATFLLADLTRLGSTMRWSAAVTAAGSDSDTAPDKGPDLLNPKRLSFNLNAS